jgi:hypothetical protein
MEKNDSEKRTKEKGMKTEDGGRRISEKGLRMEGCNSLVGRCRKEGGGKRIVETVKERGWRIEDNERKMEDAGRRMEYSGITTVVGGLK